jgi:hypothetical protein
MCRSEVDKVPGSCVHGTESEGIPARALAIVVYARGPVVLGHSWNPGLAQSNAAAGRNRYLHV